MGEGEESIGRHVKSDRDIVLERTCLNSFIAASGTGDIRCIWFRLYLTSIQSLLTGFTYNVTASYAAHYGFNTVGDHMR